MDDIKKTIDALDLGADYYLVKDRLNSAALQKTIRFALESRKKYLDARLNGQLKNLIENNLDPQMVITAAGYILYANPAAREVLSEHQGLEEKLLNLPETHREKTTVSTLGEFQSYFEVSGVPVVWNGSDARLLSIRDISRHVLTEAGLEKANAHNKFLLKELQHRVINSFTILLSLLSLMQDSSDDGDGRGMLKNMEKLISSMLILYK